MFLSRAWVRSVSFSPCGGRIASASSDCTIKVWEASTGTCQSTLRVDRHDPEVISHILMVLSSEQLARMLGFWGSKATQFTE